MKTALVILLSMAAFSASAAEFPYSSDAACRDGSASAAMQRPGGYCSLTSVGTPRVDPGSHGHNFVFIESNVAYIQFESGKVRPLADYQP